MSFKAKRLPMLAILTTIAPLACGAPPQATEEATAIDSFPELTGPYLGQQPPGTEPELFAPGIVSTGLANRDITITPEGDEIFFSVSVGARGDFSAILSSRLENGRWTRPEATPFASTIAYMDLEPFVAPDGEKLLFVSDRPREGLGGEAIDPDIWVVDRIDDGWSEPYNLGPPVNSEAPEFFPSVTDDGTIYFTRENPADRSNTIMRARWSDGAYAEPEALPEQVNSGVARFNASIARDESYLLLPIFGREDSLGATDYYVSFRSEDDTWSKPMHMGDRVNSASGLEYSAYVSPDGQYFFFMSGRKTPAEELGASLDHDLLHRLHQESGNGNSDIYWMKASFIEELRPTASGDENPALSP